MHGWDYGMTQAEIASAVASDADSTAWRAKRSVEELGQRVEQLEAGVKELKQQMANLKADSHVHR
jgi:uncharacterized protein YceH (UPF0502 family)